MAAIDPALDALFEELCAAHSEVIAARAAITHAKEKFSESGVRAFGVPLAVAEERLAKAKQAIVDHLKQGKGGRSLGR